MVVLDGGHSNGEQIIMSYSPVSFDEQGTGTSSGLVTNYTNASAITAIPQGQAVSVNSSGLIVPLDVSSQASWNNFVGYANARIPTSTSGTVIANGRLTNITTAYAVGTALYVDTNGNPTSTIPSVGVNGFVSGDAVIFYGVVVQNQINPSESDIAIFTQMVGTL
jgi:hypothetical protein